MLFLYFFHILVILHLHLFLFVLNFFTSLVLLLVIFSLLFHVIKPLLSFVDTVHTQSHIVGTESRCTSLEMDRHILAPPFCHRDSSLNFLLFQSRIRRHVSNNREVVCCPVELVPVEDRLIEYIAMVEVI